MKKEIEKCRYCEQEGVHIHTDNRTYVINGFPENSEAKKIFDIVNEKIIKGSVNSELEEQINKLRYCDWISDELFFKIRHFLLNK